MVFKRIKQTLFLAAAFLAAQAQAQMSEDATSSVDLIANTSPTINNSGDSESCKIHQGDHITLVACDNGYELYETHALATEKTGITNYGENRQAIAVNRSLQSNKKGYLTFVVEGQTLVSAHWDHEANTVSKRTVLNLALEGEEQITDLYLFDDLVAVRVDDGMFKFFPLPLVAGNDVSEIPNVYNSTADDLFDQFEDFTDLLVYDMFPSRDEMGQHVYELYGVLETALVKVSYKHDSYENKMTHNVTEVELFDSSLQYRGELIRGAISVGDFVISCADCNSPSVKWYDHDLNLVHNMNVPREDVHYELAVYAQDDEVSLQTYIAGPNEIQIILQVTDLESSEGEQHYFSTTEAKYEFPAPGDATVSLSKGTHYLVFKESDQDTLSIMPACENDSFFDKESFECVKCEDGLKSWGLQSEECVSCIRIWWWRSTDDYSRASYENLCTSGLVKSAMLFILVPFLSIVAAVCICLVTRDSGLDDEHPCCSCCKKVPENAFDRKVNVAKGFNRKNSTNKQKRKESRKKKEKVVSRHSMPKRQKEGGQKQRIATAPETQRDLLTARGDNNIMTRQEIEMEDMKKQLAHANEVKRQQEEVDYVDSDSGPEQKVQSTPGDSNLDSQNLSINDFQGREIDNEDEDSAEVTHRDFNNEEEKIERTATMRTTSKHNNRKPHK